MVWQIKYPATVLVGVHLRADGEERLGSLVAILVKACLELALLVIRRMVELLLFVVVVSIIRDRG